jgi:hypothetical protein
VYERLPGLAGQRSPEPVFLKWKGMEAAPDGDFYVTVDDHSAQVLRVNPDGDSEVLIEREALHDEERATISGVIKNRLDAERSLQIDAALLYAVNERGVRVTQDIRDVDSIYNIYDNLGLPPTPIGAAGTASIRAAYEPEDHDYLYYVKVDHEGRHAFAETFEEHQRNVQRLRELQQEADEEPIAPVESPPSTP